MTTKTTENTLTPTLEAILKKYDVEIRTEATILDNKFRLAPLNMSVFEAGVKAMYLSDMLQPHQTSEWRKQENEVFQKMAWDGGFTLPDWRNTKECFTLAMKDFHACDNFLCHHDGGTAISEIRRSYFERYVQRQQTMKNCLKWCEW